MFKYLLPLFLAASAFAQPTPPREATAAEAAAGTAGPGMYISPRRLNQAVAGGGGITNNQVNVTLGLTNGTLDRMVAYSPDAASGVAGPGTASATINTHIVTTTNGGFAGIHMFDDIILSAGEQYTIMYIEAGNNKLYTFEPIVTTRTSVTWGYYRCPIPFKDNVGHFAGAIRNDAALGLSTYGFGLTFSGPEFTNGWRLENYSLKTGGGFRLQYFQNGLIQNPDVWRFDAPNGNNYEAMRMFTDGSHAFKYGFTNANGDPTIIVKGNPDFQKGFEIRSNTVTSFPTAPAGQGAIYFWNSNGQAIYLIVSTNGNGGTSAAWTSTNLLWK